MKIITLLVLLVLALFPLNLIAHPHHHTLAIFEYNSKNQQLELGLKILNQDINKLKNNEAIETYIQKHLHVDNKSVQLTAVFQGQETDHEYVWFYYTYPVFLTNGGTRLFIKNSLLKSINHNQFNTVKLTVFKKTLTYNYSPSETSHAFVFE